MLQDQSLQLVDRAEEIHAAATVRICGLEEPHVVAIEERRPHRHGRTLSLLLTQLVVLLDVLVHVAQYVLLAALVRRLQVLLPILIDHVEVVGEFFELALAEGRAKVDDERDRNGIEDVLVQVLAQFRHGLYQVVLGRDQRMILEMIHQVLLPGAVSLG